MTPLLVRENRLLYSHFYLCTVKTGARTPRQKTNTQNWVNFFLRGFCLQIKVYHHLSAGRLTTISCH